MKLDLQNLPQDPALLSQMILDLLETLQTRDRTIDQLRHQLAVLKRNHFGKKSEKVDINQLRLTFAELAEMARGLEENQGQQETESPEKKNGHGRKPLPPDLPREEIKLEIPESERICETCKIPMERIGEESSEQLEYIPASFYVKRFVRVKYSCKQCHTRVVIADKPVQPIEKGIAGPGLLAHVIVSKYADHLPLYRQEAIFQRHGVEFNRSTLCNWIGASAKLLAPLYDQMIEEVLESRKIHTDDTTIPVQDKNRDTTRKGRIWVYTGDRDHPHIVFDYTPSRQARDGPVAFLEGFSGYLQADAFSGYDRIYAPGNVIEVACWAHARRKFYDAQETDAQGSHAALSFIKLLYQVERQAKDESLSDDEVKELRQQESRPVLANFKNWLDQQKEIVLPKSPLGTAIAYTLSNWEALNRYLEDGILDIDNNFAERELRRVAIGRKNWMFTGSDNGGNWAAILYSLIATCKYHNIEPWAYLRDVLESISTHPASRIKELLPDRWAALHAPVPASPVEK